MCTVIGTASALVYLQSDRASHTLARRVSIAPEGLGCHVGANYLASVGNLATTFVESRVARTSNGKGFSTKVESQLLYKCWDTVSWGFYGHGKAARTGHG